MAHCKRADSFWKMKMLSFGGLLRRRGGTYVSKIWLRVSAIASDSSLAFSTAGRTNFFFSSFSVSLAAMTYPCKPDSSMPSSTWQFFRILSDFAPAQKSQRRHEIFGPRMHEQARCGNLAQDRGSEGLSGCVRQGVLDLGHGVHAGTQPLLRLPAHAHQAPRACRA